MKSDFKIDEGLIVRYLAGEATPEEAVALDDWLDDPANKLYFSDLQSTWNESYPGKTPRPVRVAKAWDAVSEQREYVQKYALKELVARKTVYKIAAAFLLLITFGVLFLVRERKESSLEITMTSGDSLKQITLSDRSSVVLNKRSTFRYPKVFGNQREVSVEAGEFFFRVTPDTARPFVVRAGAATIQVVGTAFNVLVKPSAFEVSVETGKVLVYIATDSILLEPGQAVLLNMRATSFTIKDLNQNSWAYATHKYVFNDTPLHEVFEYVENASGCAIRMQNPNIGNCKLTATFESVSTDYMLTLITEALNLSVTKNDDRTFTVGGEGCH